MSIKVSFPINLTYQKQAARNKQGVADLWITHKGEYLLEISGKVVSFPHEYLLVHKR